MGRILLIGDIHIGRRPSRLPENLDDYGLSASELTPAAAWHQAVRYACDQSVDAVVLAGDVVEYDNYMFEAHGHLEVGVKTLVEAGIQVVGVVGNHDVEALPRLAGLIPEFRLIGRGGKWECVTVDRDEESLFHILGWSYPERRVTQNPFVGVTLPKLPEDRYPLFGVIHGDLGASGGHYAPIKSSDLDIPRVDGWFLGHIHKPSDLTGKPPIGYLGSLVGLDPNEIGPRGPWLLTLSERGKIIMEHIPLAPLRWEKIIVPVDSLESIDDLPSLIKESLESMHGEIETNLGGTRVVGCRITFTGSTDLYRELKPALTNEEILDFCLNREGVLYFIDKIYEDCSPVIDLESLAAGDDPPAIMARILIALRDGSDNAVNLTKDALRGIDRDLGSLHWFRQKGDAPDEDKIRDLLFRAGTLALEELLEQSTAPEGIEETQ